MLLQASRWLKKVLYGMLVLVLTYMGAYAALYRFSEHHQLQAQFDKLLHTTGRKITFDTDIKRRIFPRPTLILSHVRLSEANGQNEAFYADEIRIGMAWQSLLGADKREIEKLVLEQARIHLHLNQEGHWNIHDLWTLPQSHYAFIINRLYLDNAQININSHQEQLQFNELNWLSERINDKTYRYHITAQATYPLWEKMKLQAEGQAQIAAQSLRLPDLNIAFQGEQDSYNFSGSLNTIATWQEKQFTAENTRINLKSKRFNSHFDTTIAAISGSPAGMHLQGVNTVFSLNSDTYLHSGSFNMPNAQGHRSAFTGDAMTLSLKSEHAVSGSISNFTLNSSGSWLNGNGINLPDLKLSTLQTPRSSYPLFVSEWEGSAHWDDSNQWNLQLKGLFERQPALIELVRHDQTVLGQFKFNKLDFNKYLHEQHNTSLTHHLPNWSPSDLDFQIGFEIGELKLPELTLMNLRSQVSIDKQQAIFEPLSAELFGGQSEGSLHVSNTTPKSYHLIQNSKNVQVGLLLQQFFGIHRLRGTGNVTLDFTSKGNTRQEMLSQLSGSLKLDVHNGEWLGFDVQQLFKNMINTASYTASEPLSHTVPNDTVSRFHDFFFKSQIENGISHHQFNGTLDKPAAQFYSEGNTDLNTGTLNEHLTINTGKGRPTLPLRLSGKLDTPSISLNYQQITAEGKTPEEKQKAISNTLKQQWQWLRNQ
ncbi:MAG: AsmA family protein [Alysiella sp.]|uniref:AsmA family protein n=1 Tax=Alysiella sp. TaxID=1872483 RepID=UPI0026DBFD45|nr:AsmA family protein [Alysiella sp.]MDO4434103.1 AsmA family protein [Alysiella sp.]